MAREQMDLAILFADVCKSTQLFETLGDARAREVIAATLSTLAGAATEHGGTIVKTIGDEIMCTFPTAERAVQSACTMQTLVSQPAADTYPNVSIRIGLQFGSVLSEHGDVFGDAVNVAARMAGLAKGGQIITTKDTVERILGSEGVLARSLGQVTVRGKQEMVEICDVIWQTDISRLTVTPGTHLPLERLRFARLTLTFCDREIRVEDDRGSFSLGRGEHNDLVVDEAVVSRNHATIERRTDKFFLIDHSTNGTFLRLDDESEVFVHREEIHVHGQGVISLGQKVASNRSSLIRYDCRR
ncbi:MAG: FHA domain-containing protein [Gemmatimonadetes bacterium]|nr:FHA domain-containing protein [Gemmatimonadota bacterium]